MRLAIFGGSGRTGCLLVRKALERDFQVTALARRPDAFCLQHANLKLVPGSIADGDAIEAVIAEANGVISVLAPTGSGPRLAISQGTAKIVAAMQRGKACRLIVTTGAGVTLPGDRPGLFHHTMRILLRLSARRVLDDMTAVAEVVSRSELDWTIVRVPMLVDGQGRGVVRYGMVGKGAGNRITRTDLAACLLELYENGSYLHEAPVVSN